MTVLALVIDEASVPLLLSSLSPNDDWFEDFSLHDAEGRVQSSVLDDVAVISSNVASAASRVVVVDLRSAPFSQFNLAHKKEAFRRILVASLSHFTNNVVIPRAWGSFSHGSRTAFHALPIAVKHSAQGGDTRIEVEKNPFGNSDFFVYNFPKGWNDLEASQPSKSIFLEAKRAFGKVLENRAAGDQKPSSGAIELSDRVFFHQENSIGFDEWYRSKLTARQREFVDAPLNEPVRLRGAAGTGKTLALAVKLLAAAKASLGGAEPVRFLFLTHSAATQEAIQSLLISLDKEGILDRVHSKAGFSFEISTLLELAMAAVGSELQKDDVVPLARDAHDGRQLQLELIESCIRDYTATKEWSLLKNLASPGFRELMAAQKGTVEFRRFAWEVMNEFACVLDADGIQAKPSLRSQYVKGPRQAWMMPLEKDVDRKVMLELYDQFNVYLKQMRAISVDQVISDYLNYLDSFRWNAVRERRGYDIIFVDELHLFNRQERMVIHGLSRKSAGSFGLFMAYDAKQAPSDTFMPSEARESSSAFWGRLNVGSIQKVELDEVFRYSPEIAGFVSSLDQAFPALDLGDEWGEYNIASRAVSSDAPTLTVLRDEDEMYVKVMERARQIKRRGGQNFTLAVLCCNADRFETFSNAGTHKKNFVPISSRDEAGATKVDAFRYILSTPEYVAGLQFDCVMLLDVNKSEVPAGPYSSSARRKFISTVYLGASRARRHLELYSTEMEGGPSDLVDNALTHGRLRMKRWAELPGAADVIVAAGADEAPPDAAR